MEKPRYRTLESLEKDFKRNFAKYTGEGIKEVLKKLNVILNKKR